MYVDINSSIWKWLVWYVRNKSVLHILNVYPNNPADPMSIFTNRQSIRVWACGLNHFA